MAGYEYNPLMPLNLQKRAKEVDPSQFATAEQGELADSALQQITSTNSDYVSLEIGQKVNNTQDINVNASVSLLKYASSNRHDLADAYDVVHTIEQLFFHSSSSNSSTDANGLFELQILYVYRYQYISASNISVVDRETNVQYYAQIIYKDLHCYLRVTDDDGNLVRNRPVEVGFRCCVKRIE
jgi:hypothetical protein